MMLSMLTMLTNLHECPLVPLLFTSNIKSSCRGFCTHTHSLLLSELYPLGEPGFSSVSCEVYEPHLHHETCELCLARSSDRPLTYCETWQVCSWEWDHKKLSCRRETARCFIVSLNISINQSRSSKVA